MMHEHGKSAPAIVAVKPTNKAGRPATEPVEPRAGDQGECGPAKRAPGTGPGKCVKCAGPHTTSRKGKEEGEVHLALPPHQ